MATIYWVHVCLSDMVLSTFIISHLVFMTVQLGRYYHHCHFADPQRGFCLRSQSWSMSEVGLKFSGLPWKNQKEKKTRCQTMCPISVFRRYGHCIIEDQTSVGWGGPLRQNDEEAGVWGLSALDLWRLSMSIDVTSYLFIFKSQKGSSHNLPEIPPCSLTVCYPLLSFHVPPGGWYLPITGSILAWGCWEWARGAGRAWKRTYN